MMLPSIFGEDLFDEMMDFPFEDDFFGKRNPLYGKKAKNMMKTDVKEHENGYEVDIDLPGFKKDELNLDLTDGYLTISASKGLDKDEEDKKGKYIRKERYAGSMSRSFYVGDGITEEDIKAKYENGILKLSIPKKEAKAVDQKKHIAIEG
ncbi:MAG: Hsp20/alpha crystallin family protein [Lachnospiraceae bacterium]|nr:Hsp20/alpha crystallin family protein [Clostridium sp.]MDD6179284.1 Hsp20/alpha crystallin family protein [Clostridium sp.]MDY4820426.1 Hsp20/alpha crystallin family protein [Lachnospiraceae bacterium]